MKLQVFTNRKLLPLVFSTAFLAVLLVAAGNPYAMGQSASAHPQTPLRIVPSAQEIPCHLWTVDADDIPFFDARWLIGAGNSVQVRIKGNFACATMPSVSDPTGTVKGRCTRAEGISEAVYLDPRPLSGESDVHVGFNEIRIGLVYHLSFAEFGTPLYLVGY
jgi:hypothetical protein